MCVFVIDSYMTPLFRSQSYMYVTGRGGLGDKGGAYGLVRLKGSSLLHTG